ILGGALYLAYFISPFVVSLWLPLSRKARLKPAAWRGRLRPMAFRRFVPSDLATCREIYRLNEPGRFPEGVFEKYSKLLFEQKVCVLVVETDEGIVATGGIYCHAEAENQACLCYGLIHPKHHGKGIGTALVLVRLALLNPKRPFYFVGISAVRKSIDFYYRFGFVNHRPWNDEHGKEHPSAYLFVTSREIRKIRK